jgi:hypothetical protein
MEEVIYDVHWEGPFSLEDILTAERENFVLYKIYATHPVYGRNVLVYIGMTTRSDIAGRIKEHRHWLENESDPVNVYFAAIGEFSTWQEAELKEEYDEKIPIEILSKIESLLIYSHQPVYNSRSKISINCSQGIRIFNTGKYGSLLPEVSGRYYSSD